MSNPYSVLGVSPSATDDEVKTAYKNLARKYHPDHYANNPLADLAAEKMKEINAAYDDIQAQRAGGGGRQSAGGGPSYTRSSHSHGGTGGGASGGQASGGYGGQTQGSAYPDIRRLLDMGRVAEADELLSGIPVERRDAEWFYLKGRALYGRGWLDEAMRHFQEAANMDPSNPEYRYAAQQFANAGRGYTYSGRSYTGCDSAECCQALLCLHCLTGGRCCC